MSWQNSNLEMTFRRMKYKGTKEQLPKVLALLDEEKVSRKAVYTVLKYFELTPDGLAVLKRQFPDV